jgi:hypothetical protein
MTMPEIPLGLISFPRSITENAVPNPSTVSEGSLAINVKDKVVYSKDDSGNIIIVGKDYDDVLTAHFTATNPHGTTAADINLDKVPNVDLRTVYLVDPVSMLIDHGGVMTEIDMWRPDDVVYTIKHDAFQVGDTIVVNRLSSTAGRITIALDTVNSFLIRGALSTDALEMSGNKSFMSVLRKANATTWIVKVIKI